MGEVWDVIVVGGGIIGSWTAYHLAQQGKRVLLLEQFFLPHSRGSSHGHSRIIRSTYTQPFYTDMSQECTKMWRELEKISGKELLVTTGLLMLDTLNTKIFKESEASLKSANLPHEVLDYKDLVQRFPMLKLTPEYKGLFDRDAGLLIPSRILSVLQKEIVKHGGVIRDGEAVLDITPGNIVGVSTKQATYLAKHLVLCPGPWAKDMLAKVGIDVPIKTMPGLVCYWPATNPEHFRIGKIPVILEYTENKSPNHYQLLYTLPILEYQGLVKTMPGMEFYCKTQADQYSVDKGCPIIYEYIQYDSKGYRFLALFPELEYEGMIKMVTRGEPPPHYAHPDQRDQTDSSALSNIIEKYIEQRVSGVTPTPVVKGACMYTMTPDKDFIIDRHPHHSNILVAAGMSGHGFMRAPVIGKLLKEMVLGLPTSYDLSVFRINRFHSPKL